MPRDDIEDVVQRALKDPKKYVRLMTCAYTQTRAVLQSDEHAGGTTSARACKRFTWKQQSQDIRGALPYV